MPGEGGTPVSDDRPHPHSASVVTGDEELFERLRQRGLPAHVAIIMDGNGRWALQQGMPRVAGHRAGAEAARDVIEGAGQLGLSYLTLFAFSTENWRRPKQEVEALMDLLVEYIHSELDELHRKNVQVCTIGDLTALPDRARQAMERAVLRTKANTGLSVILALNYGGRHEIVTAARELARKVKAGELDPNDIDEKLFSTHLATAPYPDPDLVIRPSGEERLSNFLLWQSAYAEFWLTDRYWPDFRRSDLYQAIADFQERDRRFGGLRGHDG